MTLVNGYHFSPLDYRVLRLRTERSGEESSMNETKFVVTPMLRSEEDSDSYGRLILAGRLGWSNPENLFEVAVGAMFSVTHLSGQWAAGDGDIDKNLDLEEAIDSFVAEEGGYLTYDFAQRQLRLICAMHEQDTDDYEQPDADIVKFRTAQDRVKSRRGAAADTGAETLQ